MTTSLALTRSQILAFRGRAAALDKRMPFGARSLRRAAWAGLQDSMPRAALLSIHARMAGTRPATWEHPSLVQTWGPRFSTYVVAKRDLAIFTLGRLPGESKQLKRFQHIAARLPELDSAKDMVVFCKGGTRSARALELLVSAGFKKVKNLKGGINAWAREVDQELPLY
jgi:rhodanese-related sulfurtransferase